MRMFDTELFAQEWFGELRPIHKLLYIYLLMSCDCAGVIEVNLRQLRFDLNVGSRDNPNDGMFIEREDLFKAFGKRVIPIGGDIHTATKAIIPDFIRFHYGEKLFNDSKHRIHLAVVKRIKSVGLTVEEVSKLASKPFAYDDFSNVNPQVPLSDEFGGAKRTKAVTSESATEKRVAFVRPTIEEVTKYCEERNNGVDPQKWYDFYSSNGWKVGKNPMKDWQAAVRTWERGNAKSCVKRGDNFRGGTSEQRKEMSHVL